ncbi:MAG: phage portal protein [Brevundimonas sp.]|uniref:phage portal protein n=1 Tax=Brevundimonas sp. TaxID=1871086 RepID=UPI0027327EE4|nr:phage portal protein [Brevundimonas sp.]MDP3405054.1 phage portal protein [Brevundimonas sp.]
MGLGRMIDGAIAMFAPEAGARRMAARVAVEAIRGYDVAGSGRATKGWRRPRTSADVENQRAVPIAAAAARDLVRNNKYASAGVRQMVAAAWGDGIAPMFTHAEPMVARAAQDDWDRWAESPVSGQQDFYGHGKLSVRGLYTDGNSFTIWRPDDDGPDGRLLGRTGEHLDIAKTEAAANGVRIIQGVELDADERRIAYHLFRDHPSGLLYSTALTADRVPGQYVDHLFEPLEHGQTIGISRLASVALTLRDIADVEDAKRLQEKVAACVALIRQRGEGSGRSPLSGEVEQQDPKRPDLQTIRPGMILDLPQGETATGFTPAPSNGGVEFIRQQLAAVSAVMVPYHVMTGDVSQANYSGLRASFLGQWALLDDDQQNTIIPQLCLPAVRRRLRLLSLKTGDKRFLDVRQTWALPVRRQADPIKDLMAEVIEIRSGLKLLKRALAERGINADDHLRQLKAMNDIIDELGLALETDPRRLTESGVLQQATGYLLPRDERTGRQAA